MHQKIKKLKCSLELKDVGFGWVIEKLETL